MRIATAEFGLFDTLALEFDFATLADYERFWAELAERADFVEIFGRWGELIETGGCNELWRAAE